MLGAFRKVASCFDWSGLVFEGACHEWEKVSMGGEGIWLSHQKFDGWQPSEVGRMPCLDRGPGWEVSEGA